MTGTDTVSEGETLRPVLSARHLAKTYQPTPPLMRLLVRSIIQEPIIALDDVSLELRPGEICAVVGPNGAGKTTLFRILVGLTTPTSGHATIADLDVERRSNDVRRVVGWMPAEDRSLFMRLSCWENLYFHGRLQGMNRAMLRQRIPEVMVDVGLHGRERTAVFSLSAGMRARLQVARALLASPSLLILDEPTGAVDPLGAQDLLELITKMVVERGMAALISSHRLEEIEALHSSVILLDQGRTRFHGDLDDFRRRWDRPQLELVFRTPDVADAAAAVLGPSAFRTHDRHTLTVALASPPSSGEVLLKLGHLTGDLTHVREVRLPLRELLVHMYRNVPLSASART